MERYGAIGALCAAALWAAAGAAGQPEGKTLKVTFGFVSADDSVAGETFGGEVFNVLSGSNDAGRFASVGASGLVLTDGSASPWGLSCSGNARMAKSAAGLTEAKHFADAEAKAKVEAVFPMEAVTRRTDEATGAAQEYGSPLQCNTANDSGDGKPLTVTLGPVVPGATYRLTVLAGRGNDYGADGIAYTLSGGGVTAAEIAAKSAGNSAEQDPETMAVRKADTNDGAWVLMTFEAEASGETLTLSASEAAGSIKALALTCTADAPPRMLWVGTQDGLWTEPANWTDYAEDADVAWLEDLEGTEAVTVGASCAAVGQVSCLASATAYTLLDLPDGVAVHSAGRLTLADADAVYGHAVTGDPVYAVGGKVTLTESPEVPVYVLPEGDVPGGLILAEGVTVASLTLGRGCTLAGAGSVTALTVESGAAVDVSRGMLRIGTVAPAPQPTPYGTSLPAGEPAPVPGAVVLTLRGQPPDPSALLRITGAYGGVAFQAVGSGGAVTAVTPDGDGYLALPPGAPGYRLRLR